MTENISDLYNNFRSNIEDRPNLEDSTEIIIAYFQKNAVFFNNVKSFKNEQELRLFIEMTEKYVEAIYQKDRYNQAIDLVNQFQTTIDNEIVRLNAHELKDAWYYGLQFVKGMAHYRLRDYKTATPIFKTLTAIDPKNDNFKNWLRYSLNAYRLRIVNVLSIIFIVLGAIEIFFKPYIPNYYLRQFILTSGFIGLVTCLIYESYLKRSLRKPT